MALKYSRQRESIKLYLAQTKEHPTADMVYTNIRKKHPNISLGTVYRNLKLLVDHGEIIKFSAGDGSDRFDGNTKPHYHFICTKCSEVSDIYIDDKVIESVNTSALSDFDGEINGHDILFYGNCSNCKKDMQNKI